MDVESETTPEMLAERIRTTLESLARGHFIEWGDKSFTRIDMPTIKALQKLFFGGSHAGI